MKEFIDKTSTQSGTPINRANLMAIQGFIAKTTVFKDDGSIEETNDRGEKLTTVFEGNTITETFVGAYTITKKTTFLENGNIEEEIIV